MNYHQTLFIHCQATSRICQLLMGSSYVERYYCIRKCAKVCMQIATRHRTCEYQELLEICAIPSLAERRTKLKLCQLYNILHGHCYFPKIFLCTLQIITLLDPITWLLFSPLHTPILFFIYIYPIPYLCGIICLKSKHMYLLPPYKLLRNYCFIGSCHYFTLVVLVCLIIFLLWVCFILASYFAIAYPLYIARIVIDITH